MNIPSWVALLAAALLGTDIAAAQTGAVEGTVAVPRGSPEHAVILLVPEGEVPVEPPAEPVVVDQVGLRFVPRVVVVPPGTTVAFPNSDPIMHNVFSPRGPGDGFNLGTYAPGETRSRRFTTPGMHVILCHVHPEMLAYVAVAPTPYHALVRADGTFVVEDLPSGRYALQVWHGRRPSVEREVVVPAGTRVRVDLVLGSTP